MLLQEARPESAYLKLGIYGEAGSGKTFTSSQVAIGLARLLKSKKPAAFVDTEGGSDYVLDLFAEAKVPVVRAKTRAFADLLTAINEAEKECDVMIIDSITHFWAELVASYKKQNGIKFMSLKHWGPLKETWNVYTERFLNSRLHIVVAGRSADKWEDVENPDDGAKEMKKVGTKMRTETQFGYEPSILCEMEAVQLSSRAGGKMVRRVYVQKDKFHILDGATADNPTFEFFLPHISRLNLGGEHVAFDEGRDSTGLFERNDLGERKHLQKEILLEKVQNEMKKLYPGTSREEQIAKIAVLEEVFGTNSWTQIERFFSNERIAEGYEKLLAKSAATAGDIKAAEEKATKAKPTKKAREMEAGNELA